MSVGQLTSMMWGGSRSAPCGGTAGGSPRRTVIAAQLPARLFDAACWPADSPSHWFSSFVACSRRHVPSMCPALARLQPAKPREPGTALRSSLGFEPASCTESSAAGQLFRQAIESICPALCLCHVRCYTFTCGYPPPDSSDQINSLGGELYFP